MECIIAKVVEFYVSDSLSKQSRDIARKKCGNLIEFRSPKTDQANSHSAQWSGNVRFILHDSLQTLRAVERVTRGEQYRKKVGDPNEKLL